MAFVARNFYSVLESSFRWECSQTEIVELAMAERIDLVIALPNVRFDDGSEARMGVIEGGAVRPLFRGYGLLEEHVFIRQARQANCGWKRIEEPKEGIRVMAPDVLITAAEVERFEDENDLVRRVVSGPGAQTRYDWDGFYTGPVAGGNTKLVFTNGAFGAAEPALGGTFWNCAGGPTPWGTWLTCEEGSPDLTEQGGKKHGYVFEVSPETAETTGTPIVAMGRMDHEAVAVDPITSAVYLTEDDRNQSGLYKFVPNDTSKRLGSLEQGGRLYMAKVAGVDRADLLNPQIGDSYQLEWVEIADPDLDRQPFTEAPHDAENRASGPFVQGRDLGGLRQSRGEGCWYSARERLVYVVDTSSGVDAEGAIGRGEGSVWTLDPTTDTYTCIFQSEAQIAGDNFDNVTVSPRGGVLLCEDGDNAVDAFGTGSRLMGLTPAGETYIFAKNNVTLTAAQIQAAGKSATLIAEEDYRSSEFAGATFDPSGKWLFVNIQSPGITVAITGPWERGLL